MLGSDVNSRYLSFDILLFRIPLKGLQGIEDIENDESVGFQLISTDDIDDIGIPEIVRRIRARVGDSPVYLRCDTSFLAPTLLTGSSQP